jgi:Aldo/keto reductase family
MMTSAACCRGSKAKARESNQRLVLALQSIAERKRATSAQVALAWLLAQKPWIVPIPGTTKLHRLEENVGAGEIDLTSEELAEISAILSSLPVQGERGTDQMMTLLDRWTRIPVRWDVAAAQKPSDRPWRTGRINSEDARQARHGWASRSQRPDDSAEERAYLFGYSRNIGPFSRCPSRADADGLPTAAKESRRCAGIVVQMLPDLGIVAAKILCRLLFHPFCEPISNGLIDVWGRQIGVCRFRDGGAGRFAARATVWLNSLRWMASLCRASAMLDVSTDFCTSLLPPNAMLTAFGTARRDQRTEPRRDRYWWFAACFKVGASCTLVATAVEGQDTKPL